MSEVSVQALEQHSWSLLLLTVRLVGITLVGGGNQSVPQAPVLFMMRSIIRERVSTVCVSRMPHAQLALLSPSPREPAGPQHPRLPGQQASVSGICPKENLEEYEPQIEGERGIFYKNNALEPLKN